MTDSGLHRLAGTRRLDSSSSPESLQDATPCRVFHEEQLGTFGEVWGGIVQMILATYLLGITARFSECEPLTERRSKWPFEHLAAILGTPFYRVKSGLSRHARVKLIAILIRSIAKSMSETRKRISEFGIGNSPSGSR